MLPSRGGVAPPLLFVAKQGRRVIWGHAPSRAGVRFVCVPFFGTVGLFNSNYKRKKKHGNTCMPFFSFL